MYGYDQIIKAADEMGVNRAYALQCRIRYIKEQAGIISDQYADLIIEMLDGSVVDWPMYDRRLDQLRGELENKRRELQLLRRRMAGKVKTDEITEDMIARAKNYPVELLVEFRRGKAQAWCHDDRNPSAFHGTRTNTVQCPVCAKGFDPIAVLMQRDGMQFADAVRQLQ